jgi:NADPH2:quinone reductase
MKMHAGWYERCGPPEDVIEIGEMEAPEPGPGEVLVRLYASGINPSDYKRRGNVKQRIEFPRVVPHSDGAGIVAAVGAGVSAVKPGDRVFVFNGQWQRPFGTAAEYIALPAFQVRPLPASLSFAEGACLGIPAMTGYHAVFKDGPVAGQTIYVPAAAGRVGAYAVQFAKWGGARVIASASGPEKTRIAADLGADIVLDRAREDIPARVLEATGGAGVDRVIEIEFGGNMAINERILAERATICSYASAAVAQALVNVSPRRARNMSIHFIFVYTISDAEKDAACNGIIRAVSDGGIRHRIADVIPLSELARAHREAELQSGTGHMVVEIP